MYGASWDCAIIKEKDIEKAIKLWQKTAELGFAVSQMRIGICFYTPTSKEVKGVCKKNDRE